MVKLKGLYSDQEERAVMNQKKVGSPHSNRSGGKILVIFLIGIFLNAPLNNTGWAQENPEQERSVLPPYGFNPCIRVLSIDGGGVRGIIPSELLARIERETGKPISSLFDFIAGTSTGAVIALALTKPAEGDTGKPQFSAKDLVGFYERDSQLLFPPKSPNKDETFLITQTRYSPDPPIHLFNQTFGKTGLEKSIIPVLVPTYNIKGKKPFFFKSWRRDTNRYTMSEVAGAAVAAPGYFPPVKLSYQTQSTQKKRTLVLVDGGVFANNPMRYAIENSYQIGDILKGLFLLSLGTGKTTSGKTNPSPSHWEESQWQTPLQKALFSDPPDNKENPEESTRETSSQITLRIEPVIPAENSAMDNAGAQNLLDLKNISEKILRQDSANFSKIIQILKKPRPAGCFRAGNAPA